MHQEIKAFDFEIDYNPADALVVLRSVTQLLREMRSGRSAGVDSDYAATAGEAADTAEYRYERVVLLSSVLGRKLASRPSESTQVYTLELDVTPPPKVPGLLTDDRLIELASRAEQTRDLLIHREPRAFTAPELRVVGDSLIRMWLSSPTDHDRVDAETAAASLGVLDRVLPWADAAIGPKRLLLANSKHQAPFSISHIL